MPVIEDPAPQGSAGRLIAVDPSADFAEDLGAAVGATAVREQDGSWTPPFEMVRNLCLFAAHAAGVAAIDTIHADFRDPAGLERAWLRSPTFTKSLIAAELEMLARSMVVSKAPPIT